MDWLEKQIKSYLEAKYEGDRLLEKGELEDANLRLQEAMEGLDRIYRREHDETFKLLSACWSQLVEKNLALGDAQLEDENVAQAREHYQIALDLAQTKEAKDEIRIKLGQTGPEKATTGLARFFEEVQASPQNPEALYNFATELALEGFYPEAVTYFEKLVEATPDDPETMLRLANALADCERYADAERAYVRARELGCEEAEIEFWMGKLQMARGDHPAAARHMLRTLELQADHLEAHRSLAHMRAVDGDYEKAIFSFGELLKLDPEDSEAYFELGELHEIRDEMEKARACWQKAVEVEPDGDYASLAQDKLDATAPEDTAA